MANGGGAEDTARFEARDGESGGVCEGFCGSESSPVAMTAVSEAKEVKQIQTNLGVRTSNIEDKCKKQSMQVEGTAVEEKTRFLRGSVGD